MGKNSGNFVNDEQLNLLTQLETEIHKYNENPTSYPGFVGMLDAPGNSTHF